MQPVLIAFDIVQWLLVIAIPAGFGLVLARKTLS